MQLKKLSLVNFRNHPKREFVCGQMMLFEGDNGSGKSNLLEAIYLLATGKSFRADKDEEMISYNQQVANIQGSIFNTIQSEKTELGIILTDGSLLGTTRKRFEVNGVPKRMMDFTGIFRAVMFGPKDMDLVTGSPGIRRKYLDFVIAQKDREYRRNLVSYEKGLRQRNKLLEQIREGTAVRNQLFFWDKLLIKNGEYITRKREEYIGQMNNLKFTIYKAVYDMSVISENRLKQYEIEEVAAGNTLVGPHRDDFIIEMLGRDVSKYGSRGEQRMAVFWLKEGELDYLTIEDELPVLLLDDIFSELDHEHRKEVSRLSEKHINLGGQVIMTTADKHMAPTGGGWNIINL